MLRARDLRVPIGRFGRECSVLAACVDLSRANAFGATNIPWSRSISILCRRGMRRQTGNIHSLGIVLSAGLGSATSIPTMISPTPITCSNNRYAEWYLNSLRMERLSDSGLSSRALRRELRLLQLSSNLRS